MVCLMLNYDQNEESYSVLNTPSKALSPFLIMSICLTFQQCSGANLVIKRRKI